MRAFVRSALYQGHSVLGLRDGIDGLLQDKVCCICFSIENKIKFELLFERFKGKRKREIPVYIFLKKTSSCKIILAFDIIAKLLSFA